MVSRDGETESEGNGRHERGEATSHDVVIVGGGHNGLVAAAYLARAGLSVLVLERADEVGGAVASVTPFSGVAARLSRYSDLVGLFPDQIVSDLELSLDLRSRVTASYTPVDTGRGPRGLLAERSEGTATEESFADLTGSAAEYRAWQDFYAGVRKAAEVLAPTLLQPLPSRAAVLRLVTEAAGAELTSALFERPLGEVLESTFADDVVRGVVFTDGLIGAHTHAHDPNLLQNRVFLYHLIGNGTGEWRVPVGGMGSVSRALHKAAVAAGAQVLTGADVQSVDVESTTGTVGWRDREGIEHSATARYVLANVAPEVLDRLRGRSPRTKVEGSQLKINMVLTRLPQLRSGVDPTVAFAGTFHIDESYSQLERAYAEAESGVLPTTIPAEIYCHTLTDPSILAPELIDAGWHTLTLFGLHTPARLFASDNAAVRAEATARALAGLNRYLVEPIEGCIALDDKGVACIEAKSPLDLESELALPGGNIFHTDLQWPFVDEPSDEDRWGVGTDQSQLLVCGSGARRGGAVSGIGGHNAAMAVLERENRVMVGE